MKAEELMIEDWVNIFGIPKQIEGIRNFRNGDEIVYYDGDDGDFITAVTPIPLTSEILEKNGFEHYEPYDPEIKTEGYKSNDNRIHIRWEKTSKGNWFCIIYTKGMMEQLMLGISYVHELQHALILCKIEKDIVL